MCCRILPRFVRPTAPLSRSAPAGILNTRALPKCRALIRMRRILKYLSIYLRKFDLFVRKAKARVPDLFYKHIQNLFTTAIDVILRPCYKVKDHRYAFSLL